MSQSCGSLKELRPAGLLETYHLVRQALNLDTCVIVAATFSGPPLERSKLYSALADVLSTQPRLFVVAPPANELLMRKGPPTLKGLPSIDLERAVKTVDEDTVDLHSVMENALRDPIDPSTPDQFWRLVFVKKLNLFIFACHHGLADGWSTRVFLLALFKSLDKTDLPHVDNRIVPAPENLTIDPPLEELTDLTASPMTVVSTLSGMFLPPSWTLRGLWSGNALPTCAGSFNTRLRVACLPAEKAKALRTSARAHGTTLTGIIHEASVVALSKLIKERDPSFSRITTCVPISLRPLMKGGSDDNVGDHTSAYESSHTLSTAFSWDAAAKFSRDLKAAIPKTCEKLGLLRYLNWDFRSFLEGKLGKKNAQTLEISNLGALPASADDAMWKADRFYFAQCNDFTGSALKLNVAGCADGSVNFTVTWAKDVVEDSFAGEFTRVFEEEIARVASM